MSVEHAVLGASSSERWMNCPGSVALSEGMDDNTSSVYAEEGTAAHALGARALQTGRDPDAWVGVELEGVEVTEDMAEAVGVYVDHVRGIMARLPSSHRDRPCHYIEQRFNLAKLNPPAPMFGTADFASYDPFASHLDVVDYKHGQGVVVDPTENSQLLYYALGAMLALWVKPAAIRVTIVQPRGFHPDGPIRSYDLDYEELKAFKFALFAAAEGTLVPGAPLKVGEWCRFCPALSVCPAQYENAVELAQDEFEAFTPAKPETLSLAQLDRVLQIAPQVEEWIKAVRLYVSARIEAGEPVDGWKLVAKRGVRRWLNADAVHEQMVRQLGEEAAYRRKPLSPAQAEKALKKIGHKLDAELWETVSGGSNLVPAHDERLALPTSAESAADEFAPYVAGSNTPTRAPDPGTQR